MDVLKLTLNYIHDWKDFLKMRLVCKSLNHFLKESFYADLDISSFFNLHNVEDDDFFWQAALYDREKKQKRKNDEVFRRLFQLFCVIPQVRSIVVKNRVLGRRTFLNLVAAFVCGQMLVTNEPSDIPTPFSFPDKLESFVSRRNLGKGLRSVAFENCYFAKEGCACCDSVVNQRVKNYWNNYWKQTKDPEFQVFLTKSQYYCKEMLDLGLEWFCGFDFFKVNI